ncbi:unnamed protein product [Caenorhabditis brenneri]
MDLYFCVLDPVLHTLAAGSALPGTIISSGKCTMSNGYGVQAANETTLNDSSADVSYSKPIGQVAGADFIKHSCKLSKKPQKHISGYLIHTISNVLKEKVMGCLVLSFGYHP